MRKGQTTQTCKQAKKPRYDPIQQEKNPAKKQTRTATTSQFMDQHTNQIYNAMPQMHEYSSDYFMNASKRQTRASGLPQFMDQSNTHSYDPASQMQQIPPEYFTKAVARTQTRASATAQLINQENNRRYDTRTQMQQIAEQYGMTDGRRQTRASATSQVMDQQPRYDPTSPQMHQIEPSKLQTKASAMTQMMDQQPRYESTTAQMHQLQSDTLMQSENMHPRRQTRASTMSQMMHQQPIYDSTAIHQLQSNALMQCDNMNAKRQTRASTMEQVTDQQPSYPPPQLHQVESETLMTSITNQEKRHTRASATAQLMDQQQRYNSFMRQLETDASMSNDKDTRRQTRASNMSQSMEQTTTATYDYNASQQTRQKTSEYMLEQGNMVNHSNQAYLQNMMMAQNCQESYNDTQQTQPSPTHNMNGYPAKPRYNTRQAVNLQSSWEQSQPVARDRQRAQQMSEPAPVERPLSKRKEESTTQTDMSITDAEMKLIKVFRTKGVDASKVNIEVENGKHTIEYDGPLPEEEKNTEEGNKEENKTESKELYNQIVVRSNSNKHDLFKMLSSLAKTGFPNPFFPFPPIGFPHMKVNQQNLASCFFQNENQQNATQNMSFNSGRNTEIPTGQQVAQWPPQGCLSMSNLANIVNNFYSGQMRPAQSGIPFFPVQNNQAHQMRMHLNNNYNLPRIPNWAPNFPLTPWGD